MELRVASAGRVEWLVRPGDRVREGDVLARLEVADHCAYAGVLAPCSGVVSWLRPAVMSRVSARAVVGLLDATTEELAVCACLLRREVRVLLEHLMEERGALELRLSRASPLEQALLSGEEHDLAARMDELGALVSTPSLADRC